MFQVESAWPFRSESKTAPSLPASTTPADTPPAVADPRYNSKFAQNSIITVTPEQHTEPFGNFVNDFIFHFKKIIL